MDPILYLFFSLSCQKLSTIFYIFADSLTVVLTYSNLRNRSLEKKIQAPDSKIDDLESKITSVEVLLDKLDARLDS